MDQKLFREKSNWVPRDTQLSDKVKSLILNIEKTTINYIKNSNKFERDNENFIKLREKDNISLNELESLNKLKNNKDIIIKNADKGGAIVLMNTSSYLREAYRQLSNTTYYKKLNEPLYKSNVLKIHHVLKQMLAKNYISQKQFVYLSGPETPRNRIFYLLPKIHKPRNKWPFPDMPEGRPIVSDVESESYRISDYLEYFLNPLSNKHFSFIKDSYDFVNKIRYKIVPSNCFLVTGDVSALYTNMLHNRTIDCVKNMFNKITDPKRPDKYLLDLLEITLKNNDFEFNNEYFLQICGTAMGKKYAPSLANIYLLEFDYNAIKNSFILPDSYFRFLDDIFFIWTGTEGQLLEYNEYLNTLVPGITINLEYHTQQVNFLDITIYKNNNINEKTELLTKVFFKSTDSHQLLHTNSFHPKHVCRGILKSQFIRFKRLSSSFSEYSNTSNILIQHLKHRGYTYSYMNNLMITIWNDYNITNNIDRNHSENNNILPIILDYNSINNNLSFKYKKLIMQTDLFENIKCITAFKIPKNLGQSLIRSQFTSNIRTKKALENHYLGYKRCINTRCITCKFHAQDEVHFSSCTLLTSYRILSTVSCKSHNIIYLITCTLCNKQYVGETYRTLSERVTDHRSTIKCNKPTPISIHFNLPNHSINKHFKITIIEKIESLINDTILRKQKENYWQKTLYTQYPFGLNNLPIN